MKAFARYRIAEVLIRAEHLAAIQFDFGEQVEANPFESAVPSFLVFPGPPERMMLQEPYPGRMTMKVKG
jgi:hypothetical protein